MMLHEKTLKNILIEKIQEKVDIYKSKLGTDVIYFDETMDKYIGIKLIKGYTVLVDNNNRMVFPRGLHGKIIMNTLMKLQQRKCHVKKVQEGQTYKVRLKKEN